MDGPTIISWLLMMSTVNKEEKPLNPLLPISKTMLLPKLPTKVPDTPISLKTTEATGKRLAAMSAGLTLNLLIFKLMLRVLLHLIAYTAFVKALENMPLFKSLLKLRYHYKELPLTILDKKCRFK